MFTGLTAGKDEDASFFMPTILGGPATAPDALRRSCDFGMALSAPVAPDVHNAFVDGVQHASGARGLATTLALQRASATSIEFGSLALQAQCAPLAETAKARGSAARRNCPKSRFASVLRTGSRSACSSVAYAVVRNFSRRQP